MIVSIKLLHDVQHQVDVDPDIPILELKSKIAAVTETPVDRQRLIFQGKVLKDDDLLSAYGVTEGKVIHLVVRPAGTSPSPAPASTPQSNPAAPTIVAGAMPQGMPDLSWLFNQVAQAASATSAQNPGQAAPSPSPSARDRIAPLQERMHALQQSIDGLESVECPSAEGQPALLPPFQAASDASDIQLVGCALAQLVQVHTNLGSSMQQLATAYTTETSMENAESRQRVQNLGISIARLSTQLTSISSELMALVQAVEFGREAGSATVSSTPAQVRTQPLATASVSIHISPDTRLQPPAPPEASQPPPNPSSTVHASTGNTGAGSGTGSGSPPLDVLGMLGPMLQQLSQPSPAAGSAQSSTATIQTFSFPNSAVSQGTMASGANANPLQAALGPLMSQAAMMPQDTASAANGSAANGSAANGSAAANPMAMLGPMMAQMLSASHTSAAAPQPSNTAPNAAMGGNAPANAMGALMPMLGQMMQQMSARNGAAAPAEDDDGMYEDDDASPLTLTMQFLMQHLGLPDLMAMASGNLEPLQRLHQPLRDFITATLLDNDTSSQSIDTLVVRITDGMFVDGLHEQIHATLGAAVLAPEVNPVQLLHECVRAHLNRLFSIVLDSTQVSTTDPAPFASSLREWFGVLSFDTMEKLESICANGNAGARQILQLVVRARIHQAGPEFAMIEGMGASMLTWAVASAHDARTRQRTAPLALPSAASVEANSGEDISLLSSFMDAQEAQRWQMQFDIDARRQSELTSDRLSPCYLKSR